MTNLSFLPLRRIHVPGERREANPARGEPLPRRRRRAAAQPPASDPNRREKWKQREWTIRYLTVRARVITGRQAWEIDRGTVFDGIAFANMVQTIMPTLRHRPTVEQACASWPAFREVLERWDPTHVVATGS